jgi:hypothetical protein
MINIEVEELLNMETLLEDYQDLLSENITDAKNSNWDPSAPKEEYINSLISRTKTVKRTLLKIKSLIKKEVKNK